MNDLIQRATGESPDRIKELRIQKYSHTYFHKMAEFAHHMAIFVYIVAILWLCLSSVHLVVIFIAIVLLYCCYLEAILLLYGHYIVAIW